ncbi:MAG: ComF family protein [Candidatus Limnocylindrales bacterium]
MPVNALRQRIRSTTGRLLDLALPAACVGCDREGSPLCETCLPALRVRAGMPAGVPIGMPSDIPSPLLQLEWCGPFSGVFRRALLGLKYRGEVRLAEPLGRAVADRWREAGAGGELLVHVPVHPERMRDRGYDQAERIASVAARDLRLPHVRALVRGRATTAQFQLDRAARRTNVGGAFRIVDEATRRSVAGRWTVLVDDVVTTGATLVACAEALRDAGAIGVSAVTVARER